MASMTLAEILRRFPQLEGYAGRRFLVKYGGAAMERDAVRDAVCAEIALLSQLGIKLIVVHGGGKEISRLVARLGITTRFVDGLRVTDDETMAVTEGLLSGRINKDLVSRITRSGATALGISGRDAHTLEGKKVLGSNGEDLGHVGDVTKTDPDAIERLLSAGFVPIISPVGETFHGEPLNLNADYAAGALASALKVESCIFLTDVAGVQRAGQLLPLLTASEIRELINDGTISGGMIPKVQCAIRAVSEGCPKALICDASKELVISSAIVVQKGCGTQVIMHGL